MKRIFYTILISISGILFSHAQTNIPITLEKVLELSEAQNPTLQQYQYQQELANAKVAKAKEWWLPDLYAGVQGHKLWGAGMNTDGRFALETNRDNIWLGLGLDANWNFSEGIFKTQAANLQSQSIDIQSQVEKNRIIISSIESYYEFLSAQLQYKSFENLSIQAESMTNQIEAQVKAGLGYQSDWLLSKSNLNHIKVQMLEAKTDWTNQSAALAKLLNLDPNGQLVSVDSILNPIDLIDEQQLASIESSYDKRPELRLLELNLKTIKKEQKTTTVGLALPSLQVNGFISYFGGLSGKVEPMRPDLFTDPGQLFPTQGINAALLWRIPLGRLVYKGDLNQYKSRILLVENQMSQAKANINQEIIASKGAMINAKEQIKLAKESSEFAQEALNQSMAREKLGVIRPFEILQAQQVYIQTRLDYIKAVANYNIASYKLYVALGNNL